MFSDSNFAFQDIRSCGSNHLIDVLKIQKFSRSSRWSDDLVILMIWMIRMISAPDREDLRVNLNWSDLQTPGFSSQAHLNSSRRGRSTYDANVRLLSWRNSHMANVPIRDRGKKDPDFRVCVCYGLFACFVSVHSHDSSSFAWP